MSVEIGISEEGEAVVRSAVPIGKTYWLIVGDKLTLVELEDKTVVAYLACVKRKEDAVRLLDAILDRGYYRVFMPNEERKVELSDLDREVLLQARDELKYGWREAVLRAAERERRRKRLGLLRGEGG